MFVYVFTRPDNLVIAEGGDTVESGFFDVDLFANYVIKGLNQLAQQADHSAGKGILMTQDASTKAVNFSVKDWDDIAFISKLEEQGQGSKSKLLESVSVNKEGVTNGKYCLKKCTDTPDDTKTYFMDTFSFEGLIWQNVYDPANGDRWYRYYSTGTNSWSAWTPATNIPTRSISTANIWME